MPKRKRPVEKPKDQFKRFVETAREHKVSDDDAKKAFAKVSSRSGKPSKAD